MSNSKELVTLLGFGMLFPQFCWFIVVLRASSNVRKILKRSLLITESPMWWSGCKSQDRRNYVTFTDHTVFLPLCTSRRLRVFENRVFENRVFENRVFENRVFENRVFENIWA